MDKSPFVTVYMPTHNRCELLQRAVRSVFNQTYRPLELIIVDDGSVDETDSYLKTLQHDEIEITCLRQPTPRGACAARNLAIAQAKGEFVTGLDDDDEFLPQRIADLVAAYDPLFAFVCSGFLWNYGNKKRVVNADPMSITLAQQLNYNYASNQVLVETGRLKAIEGFDEAFVACQDYDTWTRLIKKFGQAKRVTGASYLIHRDENVERLTGAANWLRGHDQFMAKHGAGMSAHNKTNQQFRRIIAKREKLSLGEFIRQIQAGLVKQKWRYFLSSNLVFLAKLRRWLLG